MTIGSFCVVLHGHMPYVLRHGRWPHGEDWLFEAAAETYLPLLSMIDECNYLNGRPRLTLGLTPVLLEQLAHPDFKKDFPTYLKKRVEQAVRDRKEFEQKSQLHQAYLATRWEQYYQSLTEQFNKLNRDLPRAFSERATQGSLELLTSAATHGYMPLLLEDSSIRAQIRAGLAVSQNRLGFRPAGMWLPEGAYRPAGNWNGAIPWGNGNWRAGLEQLVADEGIRHFFVDHHLFTNGNGDLHSVHEPTWINGTDGETSHVAALARDPSICKLVWCGFVGYPANDVYLEFHKRYGEKRGLRYWKVTESKSDLGSKDLYHPDDVCGKIHEHATHFCNQVKQRLVDNYHQTGTEGIVVACFDAELFGHWWFEGPQFLRDVLLMLNADPDIHLCTAQEYLNQRPPKRSITLSEGSWGEGGDHRVWSAEQLKWLWEIEYRCETQFGKQTYHFPWQKRPVLRKLLEKAGRELLLLQASDWPFVINRNQASDYGIKRFVQHAGRFDILTDLARKVTEDPRALQKLRPVEKLELEEIDLHDVIFETINLNWWNSP